MDSVKKVHKSGKSYKPVGKCIYCGSTENLGNEHIIPYGLNGQWILPKSSCEICAKITAEFEKDVLRGMFLEARTSLGLKTRNKEHRPALLPLITKKDGKEEVLLLPPNEHFTTICFLEYPLPAYIDERSYGKGVEVRAFSLICLGEPDEIIRKHEISEVKIKSTLKDEQICRYVGTCNDKIMMSENTIHEIIMNLNEKREIMVRIKLFSSGDAPEYLVVVGILKKEAYKSHLSKGNFVSLVDCNV